MRQFLDRLPLVFQAKGASPRPATPGAAKAEREHIARLLDATLHHRRATMKYFSMSSGREKAYVIEPYRLIYSRPAACTCSRSCRNTRSCEPSPSIASASISLHEERFTPTEIPDAAFAHSIGINEGPPEHIEIAFEPRIAPYVRERQWHASQKNADRKDGGVVLSLERLQRLGAAQLDPVVRSAGARGHAARAGGTDQGRDRSGGGTLRGGVSRGQDATRVGHGLTRVGHGLLTGGRAKRSSCPCPIASERVCFALCPTASEASLLLCRCSSDESVATVCRNGTDRDV